MDGPDAPATAGGDLIYDAAGAKVGVITGGMRSSLTGRSMAIARLTCAAAAAGTPLVVASGGASLAAKAHTLPFDDPTKAKRMAKG